MPERFAHATERAADLITIGGRGWVVCGTMTQ